MAFGRYGAWRYGEADYGEGYSETSASSPEGTVAQAKDTTVFLCRDNDVDDDVSQYLTDLTANGFGGYESTSTRADLDGTSGRSMAAVIEWGTGNGNTVIARHGSDSVAANQTWEFRVTGADVLTMTHDSSAIVTLTLPDVVLAERRFLIVSQVFPNPDSTGASDEIIATLSAYNEDTGSWAHAQATGAIASGAGYTFSVGGRWNGAVLVESALSNTIVAYRLDNAYVSTAEYCEDFGMAARPTGAETRTAVRREPARPGSAAFAADEYLGAGNVGWAGHATRANDLRLAGPVGGVLVQNSDGTTGSGFTEQTQVDARYKATLAGFTYAAGLAFPLVCSASVSRIRVRVHLSSYVTSGSTQPLTIRVLSATRNPFASFQSFGQGGAGLKTSRADLTITADHGSAIVGTGQWYDLGELALSVNPPLANGQVEGLTGLTWLLLGYRLDGGDSTLQRLRIKAIHWWPVVDDDGDTQPGTGPGTSGIIVL